MYSLDILNHIERDSKNLPSACATSCIAACCMKGNVLELDLKEVNYMLDRGTDLTHVPKDQFPKGYKVPRGKSAYVLDSDCANLDQETRLCTDYENRPSICRSFSASNDEQSACFGTREAMRDQVNSGVVDLGMPVMPKFDAMVEDLNQRATWRTMQ